MDKNTEKKYSKLNEFASNMQIWTQSFDRGLKKMRNEVFQIMKLPQAREVLVEKILAGDYEIAPPVINYIDKKTGKFITKEQAAKTEKVREIYVNGNVDRIVLNVIYRIYYEMYIDRISPYCVSYKTGVSTSKIAKKLSKKLTLLCNVSKNNFLGYKIDISKFFDSVNKETLFQALKELSSDDPIDELVRKYYADDRVIIDGEIVPRYKSLAQGCALGCFLADYVLKDIDETLSSLDVIYYRYSDDIIILGKDAKLGYRILLSMLKKKGLLVNPDKVESIRKDSWFTFLGFAFRKDQISLSEKTLKNIQHKVKTETMSVVRKAHKPATKKEVFHMITRLQNYFFTAYAADGKSFGMGNYLISTITSDHDLLEIETYCKDCLRAAYTGRTEIYGLGYVPYKENYTIMHGKGKNVKRNLERTVGPEFEDFDLLRECGWVSLLHLRKCYRYSRPVYKSEIQKMMCRSYS